MTGRSSTVLQYTLADGTHVPRRIGIATVSRKPKELDELIPFTNPAGYARKRAGRDFRRSMKAAALVLFSATTRARVVAPDARPIAARWRPSVRACS